jgi:hypothetical protein
MPALLGAPFGGLVWGSHQRLPTAGNPMLFFTAVSVPVSKGSMRHFVRHFMKAEIINSVEVERV